MKPVLDRLLVVDCEATCWETRQEQGEQCNELLEIGMVLVERASWKVLEERSFLIKPRFTKVSAFCTQLTGWTQADADRGRDIVDVLEEIRLTSGLTRPVHWFSCGEYDRIKLSSDPNIPGSVGNLYWDIGERWAAGDHASPFSTWPHHNIKPLFALKRGVRHEKGLESMLKALNLPLVGRHHNGLDDARSAVPLVRYLLS